eukprot:TRINITY_DN12471_c0_g1_i2.p1 TRINITY_DN12471_c0_g1~~TRINITY_DN12471_c0_g1_i2.p1  ORF type:complete len:139 (+),score=11.23 TRINITY_DN12471_c0_g1_i2:31-447(+)
MRHSQLTFVLFATLLLVVVSGQQENQCNRVCGGSGIPCDASLRNQCYSSDCVWCGYDGLLGTINLCIIRNNNLCSSLSPRIHNQTGYCDTLFECQDNTGCYKQVEYGPIEPVTCNDATSLTSSLLLVLLAVAVVAAVV